MIRIFHAAALILATVGTSGVHAQTVVGTHSDLEKANLAVVKGFWDNVFMARNPARAGEYLAEGYVDHNPNIPPGSGRQGFVAFLSMVRQRLPVPAGKQAPGETTVTMVDGPLVTFVRRRPLPHPKGEGRTFEAFKFETFRVHDGKIVEHWDSDWSDIRN